MQYQAPTRLDDVAALLASAGGHGRVMAGGTDLLARFAGGMPRPAVLVDIKRVAELMVIEQDSDGGFTVGAGVCGAAINENAILRQAWPGVTEAMDLIGSVQIQGRASLGGNLCNASPAADSVPALIAAGASCRILGSRGERTLAVADVIHSPGKTCLGTDEFIVSFYLPPRPARSADAYLRLIPRSEMDIAVAGAAVNLTLDDEGVVVSASVALGAVSPVPLLVPRAADVMLGTRLDNDVMVQLKSVVSASCRPINDKRGTIDYRNHVAGVLAVRAALIAGQRATAKERA
ncbi:FAD binding domain-containing protein [Pseudohongiella sp.]|uniref:FAD-binding PCMH-type domain-containing protein n=1 Tax=marine sediment metagenome TaxID=412755 RepID=A0A0F9Y4U9_9ZZZZ|nr:xanthine dehydrogenase family protein subunit M [Pseudohongiella sp.]HDZ10175.1 xanthine dehydrogenase family protein subunit M [Pseudohongiella sp.]HEA64294.1 xanthine dehydrogenase family protein subunit M [Pseudohongiella sp.]